MATWDDAMQHEMGTLWLMWYVMVEVVRYACGILDLTLYSVRLYSRGGKREGSQDLKIKRYYYYNGMRVRIKHHKSNISFHHINSANIAIIYFANRFDKTHIIKEIGFLLGFI